ncbi:hypothetical protein SIN8267_02028 [Sinobacterium norvegicum]|uniref:Uncharacterized protein n=1 Tax=Sinobacterium norvegicum TaxID=1641715 RepID=A0ABN8EJR5_9GAMM|nr:hypothetical protein [Sinobacterium norvegicum]CAH0991913.1 hypothetical protein SIN8267_02028 [Sinobacterium norvegicum]
MKTTQNILKNANSAMKIKLVDKLLIAANRRLQADTLALYLQLQQLKSKFDDIELMKTNHALSDSMIIIMRIKNILGQDFYRVKSLKDIESIHGNIDEQLLAYGVIGKQTATMSNETQLLICQLERHIFPATKAQTSFAA